MGSSLFKDNQRLQNQNNVSDDIIRQAKNIMNDTNRINSIISFLGNKGFSAETVVRFLCNKNGIDVDEFMKSISNR